MTLLKTIRRDYPIVAMAFLLLACVKFEYQTTTWAFDLPGLAGGFYVLTVIAIVLLFRIFNAVQDVCVARGVIPSRVRCKYDVLIPFGIIAAMFNIRYLGEPFHGGAGKSDHRWVFEWSDAEWNGPFLGTLIGIVLLVRVLYLLRAIAETPGTRG